MAPPRGLVRDVERVVPGLLREVVTRVNRFAIPGTIATSWWRDRASNVAVGGEQDSQHLYAAAVDLDHLSRLDDLEDSMRRSGLIVVRFPGHIHVQAWPKGHSRFVLDRIRVV